MTRAWRRSFKFEQSATFWVALLWSVTLVGCLTVAFVAQVPSGPAREALDILPLMMNHQDVYISSASWARAKAKFPLLSFERFWWAKVRAYDRKEQNARRFWKNADLTDRQSERLIFGLGSVSGVNDDVDDEDAIDFLFGRGRLTLRDDGVLVLKPEPLDLDDRDQQYMYQARVLEGDLPLVPMAPYFGVCLLRLMILLVARVWMSMLLMLLSLWGMWRRCSWLIFLKRSFLRWLLRLLLTCVLKRMHLVYGSIGVVNWLDLDFALVGDEGCVVVIE